MDQFEVNLDHEDDHIDTEEVAGGNSHATPRPRQAQALNVDGFWSSSKVRYTLQVSRAGMDVGMTITTWRHAVKAIIRRYSRDAQVRTMMEDDTDAVTLPEDYYDRQFSHGLYIASILYRRDLMEAPHYTIVEREACRRAQC